MRIGLTGARVWDGGCSPTSESPIDVWVDGGQIVNMGDKPSGEDWLEVRLPPGSVAIPGLIDAHVHMDLDPTLFKPDDQFVPSRADRDLRMVARAAEMVRAGITTARDLGGGEWRELALRDAIARGELPGPRLLCAGQPVTVPAGHCHFWGGAAATARARAAVIRRQLDHGVDLIKVMATGGVFTKGSGVDRAQFDEAEMSEMVALATAQQRSVAAHCHGAEGIRNAARAGVRTVEHCSFAGRDGFGSAFDPAAVRDLVANQTVVSPTVNEGWGLRLEKDGRETRFHLRMRAVLAALREAGVPLIASTDAGIPGVRHHRLGAALRTFGHYAAMTPLDVLRSATSDSARALGLEDRCGALRAGVAADVVVLESDPLEDLSVLESPLLVVAGGRLAHDRREAVATRP